IETSILRNDAALYPALAVATREGKDNTATVGKAGGDQSIRPSCQSRSHQIFGCQGSVSLNGLNSRHSAQQGSAGHDQLLAGAAPGPWRHPARRDRSWTGSSIEMSLPRMSSYPDDEAASKSSLQYRQHHAAQYFRCAFLINDGRASSDGCVTKTSIGEVSYQGQGPEDIVDGAGEDRRLRLLHAVRFVHG
ncbi:hypothetical protein THAOC_27241, partial [Thalassiosira oceanica]